MSASLVGSEMCIRDSARVINLFVERRKGPQNSKRLRRARGDAESSGKPCLLYTSDAADDM
eukprot:6117551-Alexandrium_andersonii.AAC.1